MKKCCWSFLKEGVAPPIIYIYTYYNEGRGWCHIMTPLFWGDFEGIRGVRWFGVRMKCETDHKLCNGPQSSFFVLFWTWNPTKDLLQGDSIRDLFIPDHWRSPTTSERVTFSPSQKGHKKNHLVVLFFLGCECEQHQSQNMTTVRSAQSSNFSGNMLDVHIGGTRFRGVKSGCLAI